ncbi:MAG: DNA repair protein RecO [Desulfobulbus sp.]|nr:DNA repair protein RecO [Desulfobulbus sp.]
MAGPHSVCRLPFMARDFPLTTCGYVLNISGYGEADKLVTLYSHDLGRFTAIAKGALKSKQRFVNKLEPYSQLRLFYQPPRTASGLYFLQEAELLKAHLPLRQNHRRYIAAAHFSEVILRFTRELDPDPELYILISWALENLCSAQSPLQISVFALIHLLGILGYRPDLLACSRCHQPVRTPHSYLLLPGNGSLLCNTCHPKSSSFPRLTVQTLRTLARAQSTPLDRLPRLHLPLPAISDALNALHNYFLHLLQQDIHSWQLLRTLIPSRISVHGIGTPL